MATQPKKPVRKRPLDAAAKMDIREPKVSPKPVTNLEIEHDKPGQVAAAVANVILENGKAPAEDINRLTGAILGLSLQARPPVAIIGLTIQDYNHILTTVNYLERLIDQFASPMEKVAYQDHLDFLRVLCSRITGATVVPEPSSGE